MKNTAPTFKQRLKFSGLGASLLAMAIMLAGAFAAVDAQAQTASSTATSTNDITGTVASTTTAGSSADDPGISNVYVVGAGNGTATFKWNTQRPSISWVSYGPSSGAYTSVTPVDGTLTTDHAVTVTGLTMNTVYHYVVSSRNASGAVISSSDRAFVIVAVTNSGSGGTTQNNNGTTNSTSTASTSSEITGTLSSSGGSTSTSTNGTTTNSTTTATTTEDATALHARISDLEALVASLQTQLSNLWNQYQAYIASVTAGNGNNGNNSNGGNNNGNGSSNGGTGTTTSSAMISNNSQTARLGTNVDFTGHGFWANEPVEVSTNGSVVTTAHADSMGNFSTGSMPVQSTLGSQSFTFRGAWSGMTASGSVTVVQ